jgi:hypothetical protein
MNLSPVRLRGRKEIACYESIYSPGLKFELCICPIELPNPEVCGPNNSVGAGATDDDSSTTAWLKI